MSVRDRVEVQCVFGGCLISLSSNGYKLNSIIYRIDEVDTLINCLQHVREEMMSQNESEQRKGI